uniref:Mediator of RNA polymerase II transcription subunit 6 n=1 Tax=Coccolithus braarudii TaxID=221442 RepID=A0A7S0L162_9EUKA
MCFIKKVMPRTALEALTTISWEDKAWLETFPLNAGTVLDYFSKSQFYDRTCNNELVKMQNGLAPAEVEAAMAQMSGFEYVVHHAHELPPTSESTPHSLYVILRQQRTIRPSGSPVLTPVRYYYVLDGVTYEVPAVHEVLKERLMHIGWLLDSAFDAIARGVELPHASRGALEGHATMEAKKPLRQSKRKRVAVD